MSLANNDTPDLKQRGWGGAQWRKGRLQTGKRAALVGLMLAVFAVGVGGAAQGAVPTVSPAMPSNPEASAESCDPVCAFNLAAAGSGAMTPMERELPRLVYADWQINEMQARHPEP